MAEQGYTQPPKRKRRSGFFRKQALGMFMVGTMQKKNSNYISSTTHKMPNKITYVMAGGTCRSPIVGYEQYLLDLERKPFLSLCHGKETFGADTAYVKNRKTVCGILMI